MEPMNFKDANCVYGANQPEYQPLPAQQVGKAATGQIITCWQLTPEELEKVKDTGLIWVSMLTFGRTLQPLLLAVEKPEICDPE